MPKTSSNWTPRDQRSELTCKKCGYTLPRSEFYTRGKSRSGLVQVSSYCKKCDIEYTRNLTSSKESSIKYVESLREFVAQYMRQYKPSCVVCGYDKCSTALEFHHKDASTKLFGLSGSIKSKSATVFKTELVKCMVLCSNCHREHHAGLLDVSNYPTIVVD